MKSITVFFAVLLLAASCVYAQGRPNIILIMVDDMVATVGTIAQAARILKAKGAKDIYLCATHPVLAGSAVEKLSKAPIKEAVFTDTIPSNQPDKKKIIKILSVAGLISEAIRRIHNSESVSSLFV